MYLSVIVPIFNEAESLSTLLAEISAAVDPLNKHYEVICIDDGSEDNSFELLCELVASYPQLRPVELRKNFGQTAAMQAGLDIASGK